MAQSNGSDSAASSGRLLPGHTAFKVGGKDVSVPPLTFWTLEVRKPEMDSISGGMSLYEYADVALLIAATSIESDKCGEDEDPKAEDIKKTFNRMKRKITFGEMRDLASTMDTLLLNSGFTPPGEAQATVEGTSPGTGTLTESSPTSQSEESAEEAPKESSVH
jgi:hypothetical protein